MQKLSKFLLRNHITLFLVGIISLAMFIRLYKADRVFLFDHEQSDDLFAIQDIWEKIKSGNFSSLPLKGQPGTYWTKEEMVEKDPETNPVYHGAFYYYFLLPISVIGNFDPFKIVIFLIFLSTASTFLIFYLGNSLFNKYVGLFSAFFYAISFWMVSYSRSIWTPSLVPFFVILALTGFVLVFVEKKETGWYLLSFGSAAASQVQVSGYFFLFFMALMVLVLRLKLPKKLGMKALLIFLFLLPLLPSLAYELTTGFNLFGQIALKAYERIFFDATLRSSITILGVIDIFKSILSDFLTYFLDFGSQIRAIRDLNLFNLVSFGRLVLFSGLLGVVGTLFNFKKFAHLKVNKKHLLLIFWFLIFFFFPWIINSYYWREGNKLGIFNNLLAGMPFLILAFSALLTYLSKHIFWVPFTLLIFLGVTYSNVKTVKSQMWSEISDFNYGLKKDIAKTIGESVTGPYEVEYRRTFRTDEVIYLLMLMGYPLPERFNGEIGVGHNNIRSLRGLAARTTYRIVDTRDEERSGIEGEFLSNSGYLFLYRNEKN